jgi:hypothetical protein
MSPWLYTLCCFLTLTFVLFIFMASATANKNSICQKRTNPWCYNDWKCVTENEDGTKTVTRMANKMREFIDKCIKPLDGGSLNCPCVEVGQNDDNTVPNFCGT